MKKLIYNILRRVFRKYLTPPKVVKYKHGKRFYSNTLIDSLIPQMVEIGDNFISAPGSLITAHDASTFLFSKKYRIEKVVIGDNVFLGANSVVLPGVRIGNNVIIGAGSIVTTDIPANCVYAGNPAKYICTVDEYIKKCNDKNALYDVPESFMKEFEEGQRFTITSINHFQEDILKEYLKRIKS